VEILNSEGKSINANGTIQLPYGWQVIFSETRLVDDRSPLKLISINYAKPYGSIMGVTFPSANPELITDNLSVRITAIDGVPSATAVGQKRINILTASQYAELPNAKLTTGLGAGRYNNVWSFFAVGNDGELRRVSGRSDFATVFMVTTGAVWGDDMNPYSIAIVRQDASLFRSPSHYLISVNIPNSFIGISNGAFSGNDGCILTSVTIPNSVTSIGSYAFTENPLTRITIGANVALTRGYNEVSFPNGFDDFYNRNGKKAGTYILTGTTLKIGRRINNHSGYTLEGGQWSYRAR